MKSLSNLNFGTNEILQKNQMKSILGGASGPYCAQVASGSIASYEEENECLTSEQYNFAYYEIYNQCMNY